MADPLLCTKRTGRCSVLLPIFLVITYLRTAPTAGATSPILTSSELGLGIFDLSSMAEGRKKSISLAPGSPPAWCLTATGAVISIFIFFSFCGVWKTPMYAANRLKY